MKGSTTCCAVLIFLCVCTWTSFVHGRLTEFNTERLPILAHNLRSANVDLTFLSKQAQLGRRSGFRFKNGDFVKTAKGGQRVKLVQTYAGYEVFGTTAVAESDMEGSFTGHLYGDVARNLHKDIPNPEACVKNVQVLLNIAIRSERLNPTDPNIDQKDGRRVIYANPRERKAKIVYVVEFLYTGESYVSFPVYYMDACANSIMFSFNKISNMSIPQNHAIMRKSGVVKFNVNAIGSTPRKVGTFCNPAANGVGGNGKTGRIVYDIPPLCLPVKKIGFTCKMEGDYAKVVDNKRSRSTTKTTPVSFTCLLGYSDAVNGAYGIANDAAYFGEMSGEFFKEVYNIRALPYIPKMVVHYGSNYENAFWNGRDMFFGDGKDYFYPLVSLDVVAHELAHGITTRNSDLLYRGQSGGINEAFSDITGAATWYYVTKTNNWEIGKTLVKSRNSALRYMNNPPKDGNSINNVWRFRPFMDVHHSSGVFNYAYYKLVNRYKMPVYKAYDSFLNANRFLWGKYTQYIKGSCNVMQASYDAGSDFRDVRRAFRWTWLPMIFCNYWALKTTLFPGETRANISVCKSRSPIFEIDMTNWPGTGVHVTTKDRSVVRILVATDVDAVNVIATGNNYAKFPTNHTRIHVKLMSDHDDDVPVTLHVLN